MSAERPSKKLQTVQPDVEAVRQRVATKRYVERKELRELARFCLTHSPERMAAGVAPQSVPVTREMLDVLTRWFARYSDALGPGVQ